MQWDDEDRHVCGVLPGLRPGQREGRPAVPSCPSLPDAPTQAWRAQGQGLAASSAI